MITRWQVAAGTSIGLAVGWGPFFVLSFGLFQKPIITELHWSRAEFSLGFSVATVIAALVTTAIGALADRYGVKKVTLAGTLVFPFVFASFSLMHSYGAYLVCAAVLGIVGPWTSYPAYLPILPIWFKRNLGAAFAIASSGIGIGTAAASILAGLLMAHFGWRSAIAAMAALLLVLGVTNVVLMLPDQAAAGVTAPAANVQKFEIDSTGLSFRQAIRTGTFWKLSIGFALVTVVGIGVNFHFAALLTDRGFSPLHAAEVASLIGTSILFARLITGVLLDYFPLRVIAPAIIVGQAVSVLLLAGGWRGATPYVAACLTGITIGGEGNLMPYAFSHQFGVKAYGKIYGFAFLFFNLGTLAGPLLLGAVFAQEGTYAPGLVGFAGLSAAAAALIFFSGNARRSAV